MNITAENIETLLTTPFFKVIQRGKYYVVTEASDINGAVIVAEDEAGKIMLVKHYRPAIQKVSIEFPRGGRDKDEALDKTAARELLEETGFESTDLTHLGNIHSNTSLIQSEMAIYHAKNVKFATDQIDGEIDSHLFVTRDELKQMVRNGEITDSHTLSAIAMLP